MTSDEDPQSLLRRLDESAEAQRWGECLAACEQLLALPEGALDSESAVDARLALAAATLNLEAPSSDMIERALREVKRVALCDELALLDEKRGAAFRYLGGLFDIRHAGKKQANLTEAAEWYRRATSIYRAEAFPEDWALLKLCISTALLERLRVIGLPFLRSTPLETSVAIESLEEAIDSCNDVLRLFPRKGMERREAADLIESAERMKRELGRE